MCTTHTGCPQGKGIVPGNILGKFFKNREESKRLDFFFNCTEYFMNLNIKYFRDKTKSLKSDRSK